MSRPAIKRGCKRSNSKKSCESSVQAVVTLFVFVALLNVIVGARPEMTQVNSLLWGVGCLLLNRKVGRG